ncbi:hypothetical protein HHL22_06960 [Hymenobacter sp. RP-2-7]|uniref:Short-chain dehydrogenase n=1 Tax=Hymenobacter polaris TaxID=2682546 RepID=A0A7Y0ACQ6_9BACT|nr:hypothetical protein [Hymenobacter polaris]NML64942.1 hypothetical protein [Hymenobacter polaris]
MRHSQAAHQQPTNGRQPGYSLKVAQVLIEVSEAEHPPPHLFLGADAYQLAAQRIAFVQQQMQQWQAMATATNPALAA